jgi:uncharacterized damage-inducible protein DinB
MTHVRHLSLALFAAMLACATQDATPAAEGTAPPSASVAADLLTDLGSVEKKLVDLAGAIPDGRFDWRPAEGVRSVREVLLHVASDNYLLPAMQGFTPDPSTGITTDYQTAVAFEKRALAKDSVIAELQKSFEFVRQSLTATTPSKMAEPVSMFGQSFTGQSAWILAVTHLHEHLGQLIAYARSNGVVPPWS